MSVSRFLVEIVIMLFFYWFILNKYFEEFWIKFIIKMINRKYKYIADKTNMCQYCLDTFPSKFDMISHMDKEHKEELKKLFKR